MNTVAFTGYRPEKLPFAEDCSNAKYKEFRETLTQVVDDLIGRGYTEYISGMAVGFDTWAAETVLEAKKNNSKVKLECAIPFPEQDRTWPSESKIRRENIIKRADLATIVCEHYHKGCFFVRNEYMVDKSDVVVCCYDGQKGGTAQTVKYALQADKIVIQINPNNASITILSKRGFD